MDDVIFVGIGVVFFAVAWLYVLACDRIVGPDLTVVEGERESDRELEQAA